MIQNEVIVAQNAEQVAQIDVVMHGNDVVMHGNDVVMHGITERKPVRTPAVASLGLVSPDTPTKAPL